jgi:hypothetical protein
MKKGKIILASIAFVAAIGTGLAFKPLSQKDIFRKVSSSTCSLQNLSSTNRGEGSFQIPDNSYYTTSNCTGTPITAGTTVFVATNQ